MEPGKLSVFLDASVLFAASDSATGASRELLRYAFRGELAIVLSELVVEEAERNLKRKRPRSLPLLEQLLDSIPFDMVEPTRDEVLQMQPYTAFKDAPVLAAARKADVYSLVTLDRRHMIERRQLIQEQLSLEILLPGELLKILRQEPDSTT